MNLFGRRQTGPVPDANEVARLGDETRKLGAALADLTSLVRTLDHEQAAMHKQVRTWMRRAVAAERAAERHSGTAPVGAGEIVTPAALPRKPVNLRGARGRIYVRHLEELVAQRERRELAGDPNGADHTEAEGGDDGLPA